MNLREQGIAKLKEFSENHLSNYAKSRNFDYGPSKRDNVSNLSRLMNNTENGLKGIAPYRRVIEINKDAVDKK